MTVEDDYRSRRGFVGAKTQNGVGQEVEANFRFDSAAFISRTAGRNASQSIVVALIEIAIEYGLPLETRLLTVIFVAHERELVVIAEIGLESTTHLFDRRYP